MQLIDFIKKNDPLSLEEALDLFAHKINLSLSNHSLSIESLLHLVEQTRTVLLNSKEAISICKKAFFSNKFSVKEKQKIALTLCFLYQESYEPTLAAFWFTRANRNSHLYTASFSPNLEVLGFISMVGMGPTLRAFDDKIGELLIEISLIPRNIWYKRYKEFLYSAKKSSTVYPLLTALLLLRTYLPEESTYLELIKAGFYRFPFSRELYLLCAEYFALTEEWENLYELQVSFCNAKQNLIQDLTNCALFWQSLLSNTTDKTSADFVLFQKNALSFQEKILQQTKASSSLWDGRFFSLLALIKEPSIDKNRILTHIEQLLSHPAVQPQEKSQYLLLASKINQSRTIASDIYLEKYFTLHKNTDELAKIYERENRFLELSNLWLYQIEQSLQPEEQSNVNFLLDRLADVYEKKLNQPLYAFEILLKRLDQNPFDKIITERLERLAENYQVWSKLLPYYEQNLNKNKGSNIQPSILAEKWIDLGILYKQKLQNLTKTISCFQHALELSPSHLTVLRLLADVYNALQNYSSLNQILENIEDLTKQPYEKVQLLLFLAHLKANKLGDLEGAIYEYKQILMLDPKNSIAHVHLEALYEKLNRWHDLISLIELRQQITLSDQEKSNLLLQQGFILHEKLASPLAALPIYEKALSLHPVSFEAFSQLTHLLEETKNYERLCQVLGNWLTSQHLSKPQEKEFLLKLYSIYEKHLDAPKKRIEILERLVRLEDSLSSIFIHPSFDGIPIEPNEQNYFLLQKLVHLFEATNQWDKALSILTKIRPPAKEELIYSYYKQLASLHERLEQKEHAYLNYLKALQIQPIEPTILKKIISHDLEKEDYVHAARTLIFIEKNLNALDEKIKVQKTLFSIFSEHLKDESMAANYAEKIYSTQSMEISFALYLQNYYQKYQLWDEYCSNSLLLLAPQNRPLLLQFVSPYELATHSVTAAKVFESLSQINQAKALYKEAYLISPDNESILSAYAEFSLRNGDLESAYKLYQSLLSIISATKKEEMVKILFRLGKIQWKLGQLHSAQNFFQKLKNIDPFHFPTFLALRILYQKTGNSLELVNLLESLDSFLQKPTKAYLSLLEELGDLYFLFLQNPEKASNCYEKCLSLFASYSLSKTPIRLYFKLLKAYLQLEQLDNVSVILENLLGLVTTAQSKSILHLIYLRWLLESHSAESLISKAGFAALKFYISDSSLIHQKNLFETISCLSSYYHATQNKSAQETLVLFLADCALHSLPASFQAILYKKKHLIELSKQNLRAASDLLEQAVAISPSLQERTDLHALYLQMGEDELDKALLQQIRILEENPTHWASYQEIKKLYLVTKNVDGVFCTYSALKELQLANTDELIYVEAHKPSALRLAQAIPSTFSTTKENLHFHIAVSKKTLNSYAKWYRPPLFHPFHLEIEKRPIGRVYYYLSKLINPGFCSEIYISEKEDFSSRISVNRFSEQKQELVIGLGYHWLSCTNERELIYRLSSLLYLLRQENLFALFPLKELLLVIEQSHELFDATTQSYQLLCSIGDIKRTANEMALTLCDDLSISMNVLKSSYPSESENYQAIRNQSLAFYVSPKHLALRKELGFSL